MIHSLKSLSTWKINKKSNKKKVADAQMAEKKFPTTVTQTEDFFLALLLIRVKTGLPWNFWSVHGGVFNIKSLRVHSHLWQKCVKFSRSFCHFFTSTNLVTFLKISLESLLVSKIPVTGIHRAPLPCTSMISSVINSTEVAIDRRNIYIHGKVAILSCMICMWSTSTSARWQANHRPACNRNSMNFYILENDKKNKLAGQGQPEKGTRHR